jgi:branched-chain amino acid transport system ATP-binding protein
MALLEAEQICVSFGGVHALVNVSFHVAQGEIFSIIGPNGAGKTTIFNCINRFYDLDQGHIRVNSRDITHIRPHEVAKLGIARTFQNIELFKNMTVVDNLLLGRHRKRKSNLLTEGLFTGSVRMQEIRSREKVEEIIDFLDLQAHRDLPVGTLPYGVQKTVELGRALAMEPKLLLLDEPSSGLNMEETEDLSFWMSDIRDELNISILMVEHNIRLVKEMSDRVMALNFGAVLAEGAADAVLEHPDVISAYLGEEGAVASRE